MTKPRATAGRKRRDRAQIIAREPDLNEAQSGRGRSVDGEVRMERVVVVEKNPHFDVFLHSRIPERTTDKRHILGSFRKKIFRARASFGRFEMGVNGGGEACGSSSAK